MKRDPKNCPHEQFLAVVHVARLLDSGKFVAEVRVRCVNCEEPFRFIGLPAGLRFDGPTVSIDGLVLHAPIEPEIETQLQQRASYQMPEIPRRH